jgi:hypothetical protein
MLPRMLDTGHPFTWAQAQAAGLTKHQLRTSAYRRVFRGVWIAADAPDTRETRLAAARLIIPVDAVLCSLTAAWIHGADVRREDDLEVHVAFPKGRRLRARPGLVVSQEQLDEDDIWLMDGVQVTSPLRTTFDSLRLLPDATGIVVADALTHLRLLTIEELRRYFADHHRLRNLRIGERRVDDVEPATESPRETRVRIQLVRAGLPRPDAQVTVYDEHGVFVARLDLAYPERKIAIEYDGAFHWHQRRADDRRRARLRELGWVVLVVSADDLYADAVVPLVARALRRSAA